MSETSPAGILPCQTLEALIAEAAITAARPFDADQVQPASLDLRLGLRAWRVRASFLPRPGRIGIHGDCAPTTLSGSSFPRGVENVR